MALSFERNDGVLIARAEGRVDGANAREFQDALDEAIADDDRAVILDFEGLNYISSAGLRVVLTVAKKLDRQGSKFAICGLSRPLREIFEISGFDKIISVHDSLQEATAAS